jgi:hypothetical protein
LQALARAKSHNQPDRFLVINIQGSRSCQDLYQAIKDCVLGPVEDFEFSPEEVAEVVKYGLCGPSDQSDELPKTSNDCRITIDAQFAVRKKRTNFPILVIDGFNPTDFTWPKDADYGLNELEEKIGDAFEFFNALTGLAHMNDGFVAFLGTKSEAFARALHKINGGSKAALARCTTSQRTQMQDGSYPFSDWQGIQWSEDDKAKVVRALYGEHFKKTLLIKGTSDDLAELQTQDVIHSLCSHDDKNIRECCLAMQKTLQREEEDVAVIMQSRTQESPTSAGCFASAGCFVDLKEQLETSTKSCTIM